MCIRNYYSRFGGILRFRRHSSTRRLPPCDRTSQTAAVYMPPLRGWSVANGETYRCFFQATYYVRDAFSAFSFYSPRRFSGCPSTSTNERCSWPVNVVCVPSPPAVAPAYGLARHLRLSASTPSTSFKGIRR